MNPNYPNVYYGEFVSNFFYAALSLHDSVNQALDYASGICWGGQSFQNTVLYSGFRAYWQNSTGGGSEFGSCTMAVYGNGNMHLHTGSPDYITSPVITHNVPTMGAVNQQYQFSAFATDPCGFGLSYTFDYGDGSGWTSDTTHTYSSPNVYTVTAEAQSTTGLTHQSSTSVTIGNMLTVQAVMYWYALYPNVYIDSNWAGTAPLNIPVSSNYHTVTVDDPTQDTLIPGYYDNFMYFTDQNSNYYYNGQSISITSPMTLTAWYAWPYDETCN